MPRELHMTYVPSQKRWIKGYKGKFYSVSCKQLGCAASKEGSWLAANSWWEAKQRQIDAQDKQAAADRIPPQVIAALETVSPAPLTSEIEARWRLMQIAKGNAPPEVVEAFAKALNGGDLSQARQEQVERGVAAAVGAPAQGERRVAAQVDAWVNILKASAGAGSLSVGRYDAYKRNIQIFAAWLGADSDVGIITAAKLEEFWAYLAVCVAEQRYSPAYARQILMTAKQFIRHRAERDVLPLPRNIGSRRFKFTDGPKPIIVFSDGELAELLAKAKGRTRLYLLLALNCGAYQADIADLGAGEIDWHQGTVTRPRSKRSRGMVVKYKLWPETLSLLKKFKAKGEKVYNKRGQARVILTRNGKPLVGYNMVSGALVRYDSIQSGYKRLLEKVSFRKPFKCLRKTASSKLAQHPQYRAYAQYFLCQAPSTVADRHYVIPSEDQFFAALDWLREKFLAPKPQAQEQPQEPTETA